MSNALDAFRAQREAAEQVHARLTEVAELLARRCQGQVDSIAHDQALRELLQTGAELARTSAARRSPSPSVSRGRDAAILAGGLATMGGRGGVRAGGGCGVRRRLRVGESAVSRRTGELRSRVELLDFVAQRVITMTPSERRQFDALMKGAAATGR